MGGMDQPPPPHPPAPQRSPARVALGVVYVLVALAGSGLLAVLSIFALSPTICPDEGGSYLCGDGSGGLLTFTGVGLLLLTCMGLAIVVPAARTTRGAMAGLAGSVVAGMGAFALVAWAASTWS